jgi:uncharacterized protein YuzE
MILSPFLIARRDSKMWIKFTRSAGSIDSVEVTYVATSEISAVRMLYRKPDQSDGSDAEAMGDSLELTLKNGNVFTIEFNGESTILSCPSPDGANRQIETISDLEDFLDANVGR